MNVIVDRVWGDDDGTRGVLIIDRPLFVTMEPVIPIQASSEYECERYFSPRFHRELFRLKNVPGHEGIAFHHGNTVADTELCILLGMSFGFVGEHPAIMESVVALNKFMQLMDGINTFNLTVKHW